MSNTAPSVEEAIRLISALLERYFPADRVKAGVYRENGLWLAEVRIDHQDVDADLIAQARSLDFSGLDTATLVADVYGSIGYILEAKRKRVADLEIEARRAAAKFEDEGEDLNLMEAAFKDINK